jgi:hypothetical protein
VAVILDDELLRLEMRRQQLTQPSAALGAGHGRTCRNGATSTRSNTPAVT